jgi:hypothetical protein
VRDCCDVGISIRYRGPAAVADAAVLNSTSSLPRDRSSAFDTPAACCPRPNERHVAVFSRLMRLIHRNPFIY